MYTNDTKLVWRGRGDKAIILFNPRYFVGDIPLSLIENYDLRFSDFLYISIMRYICPAEIPEIPFPPRNRLLEN